MHTDSTYSNLKERVILTQFSKNLEFAGFIFTSTQLKKYVETT